VAFNILAVCLELPLLLADLALHVGSGITLSTDKSLAINAFSVPVALYGILSHHFLSGLLERLVGAEGHGQANPTLREIIHELPWRRLVAADLLVTLLVVLGYLAFIIPGMLIATWMTPLLVIVNLERQSIWESMKRSYQLVRGHFWRVFVLGFLAVALFAIVVDLVVAIAEGIGHSFAVQALSHAVPSTLLMPIAALPIVVLTFDLVALAGPRAPSGTAKSSQAEPSDAEGGPS